MVMHSAPQPVASTVASAVALISLMAGAAIASLALLGALAHPILAGAAAATVLSLALGSFLLHRFVARPQYRRRHADACDA